jgi:tryptophan halogenase
MDQHNTAGGNPAARPVRRVVIVGGGTAGWMAAAALSRTLGKALDIKLVESDEIATVGVGEATIPSLVQFHQLIDVDEREFMAATQATFKLGISFENWRDRNEDYIHSFGNTGVDHWSAGFQHFWMKGRERGLAGEYGEYCLELVASEQNRMDHLGERMNYAYHLDAGRYARFLRRFSEHFGLQRIEAKIVDVEKDAATGHVAALVLDSGTRIEGDLFIDCTGFRSLLLGQTMGVEYEDWSEWLLNDSAIPVQTESSGPMPPLTRAIAHDWGWQWCIPLQHRVGNGIVFSSKHTDEDTARKTLLGNIKGKALTEPRLIRFTPGQRKQVWAGNVVGLGLSTGFLEPIESTSIHLIQRSIVRLMQMFPTDGIHQTDIDEFNGQTATDLETIRDFIILHYKVTNRRDTPYWEHVATMDVPKSLQHRIDLFRDTGRVFRYLNELFAENSWVQVMVGQGLLPQSHHKAADLMGDQELSGFLNGIRDDIKRTVAKMPTHQQYVQRYCPAGKP